ncbi:MAG TPA: DNA mismatch repair endonuclease MutL [Thermoplasmata archaeon]|nr:DNA mismatch repair endonuclease MutL [Thermoplasmata archaeon]
MSPAPRTARIPIRRLDPATVERIAAGEVVERPASVVKELVENALDAGATSVTISLDDGGLSRIEVADDGLGIPADELALALERHATNKLPPDGPVDRIASLGFRGEALAAIGTVSRLTLTSRPPDQEAATGLRLEGGELGRRFPRGRAPGTTVEVVDLFFNTPARRKFLRSAASEQLEVVATVERLYLAHPSATYRVRSGERELALYPETGSLRDAAARVLGPSMLRESFDVDAPIPGGRVTGILGRPAVAAATSRGLYLSVNGRTIASRPLAQAVRTAFVEYLPRTRFPVGVLSLQLAPDRVDVNVHPTKREVRFQRERELVDELRRRVREALLAHPAISEAPRSVSSRPMVSPSTRSRAPATAAPPSRQRTLIAGASPARPPATAPKGTPHLRLLGCLDALYWVAESDDGAVLIDQHAASERVVYEALRRYGTLARQTLVEPIVVQLSGAERAALAAHAESVRAAGFDVESFGPATHRIRSVPVYRGRSLQAEGLRELLDELAAGGRPTLPDSLEERRAASLACHAAIRAGDPVEPEEFARVLKALAALPESFYACPHGRPIFIRLPRSRLDRWFLRSGA